MEAVDIKYAGEFLAGDTVGICDKAKNQPSFLQ
jgi:hypothetical protein